MKRMLERTGVLGATVVLAMALVSGCSSKKDKDTTAAAGGGIPDHPALMEPVRSIYLAYLDIQTSMAKDSLEGVPEKAKAIATAVKDDVMLMMPSEVAEQAETLAAAPDIKAAREALKPLSQSLIDYLKANRVEKAGFVVMHCPMAEANWLERDKKLDNPYMGKAMLECGEVTAEF